MKTYETIRDETVAMMRTFAYQILAQSESMIASGRDRFSKAANAYSNLMMEQSSATAVFMQAAAKEVSPDS